MNRSKNNLFLSRLNNKNKLIHLNSIFSGTWLDPQSNCASIALKDLRFMSKSPKSLWLKRLKFKKESDLCNRPLYWRSTLSTFTFNTNAFSQVEKVKLFTWQQSRSKSQRSCWKFLNYFRPNRPTVRTTQFSKISTFSTILFWNCPGKIIIWYRWAKVGSEKFNMAFLASGTWRIKKTIRINWMNLLNKIIWSKIRCW